MARPLFVAPFNVKDKWWLPVPCAPPSGLYENARKQLQQKRDCTNQILKAAMTISNITLDEMQIPDSYLETLPKNGRSCLGDAIYRCIMSDQFSPQCRLDCLDLSIEFQASEIANNAEASIHVRSRRTNTNPSKNRNQYFSSIPSSKLVKNLMVDAEKKDLLIVRAKSIILCLKQLLPGLP